MSFDFWREFESNSSQNCYIEPTPVRYITKAKADSNGIWSTCWSESSKCQKVTYRVKRKLTEILILLQMKRKWSRISSSFWSLIKRIQTSSITPNITSTSGCLNSILSLEQWKGNSGSLHTIRYSLNRTLQEFGHLFDITNRKNTSFLSSNKEFDIALKEIKIAEKGFHNNTPEISEVHE